MPDARSKMLLNGDVMTAPPRSVRELVRPPQERRSFEDEQREVERLRSINANLLCELAALKEREAQTQRLADRDSLTGLFNRRRLLELLESSIAECAGAGQSVGLLFIDLNGFKGINDEYGHAAGDRILTTVARRIAGRVRTGDIVGRYGGDEFIVILPGIPDAAAVTRVADTIRERVALPYRIEGSDQHLTAAIGESMYPQDAETGEVLLKRADQAMYRLKAHLARPMISIGQPSFDAALAPAQRQVQTCLSGELRLTGGILRSGLHSGVVVMIHHTDFKAALALALFACVTVSGCVVVPDQRHYPGGVVMLAPPAPRVEVVGVAPTPGYVWIGGYWNWVGDRHEWVAGHWVAPRRGRHWVAPVWARQGDGWRMRPGHWERG